MTASTASFAPASAYTDALRPLLEKARSQIQKGQLREAAKTLNSAQKKGPGDARVFLLAASMAEKSGNTPGAFDALEKCVSLAPDWGPGLLELALLQARNNQFLKACDNAEKVAQIEPQNPLVLAGVVDIAHRSGHLEMAVRHLRRGLQDIAPHDPQLSYLLAQDLSALGQWEEALALWSRLIEAAPQDSALRLERAKTLIAAQRPQEAIADTTALLESMPGDSVAAYYNALAHGVTPSHQPEDISRQLFDAMAATFDVHTVRDLQYKLPELVAQKIIARYPTKTLNVLDLGCGTGLLGVYLGRLDGFLIGVDVSSEMMKQAARHGVYDRFHKTNLLEALRATPAAIYEVITALDVFIYAGDLTEAIPNAHRILLPAGDFYLSCETAPEDGPDLVLQANGRYAHKRSHIQALCQAAGFVEVEIEDLVLRQEAGQPVQGFLIRARKGA